ncbi:hypothetical protein REMIM1_PC00095 (plasmid) [Rhizobium etli bv. mimosae str. Mim1]|nr:hypothetical protein REMIM1_PC00095 [Rhizobium etli bv. mimosae str. Mim1]
MPLHQGYLCWSLYCARHQGKCEVRKLDRSRGLEVSWFVAPRRYRTVRRAGDDEYILALTRRADLNGSSIAGRLAGVIRNFTYRHFRNESNEA